MPPEAAWVRSWLAKAEEDLAVARRLLRGPPFFPAAASFHSQQAVEKFLKAYLVSHQVDFEKVHSIRYLLDLCTRIDKTFEELRDRAEPLTRYAVMGRYPVGGADPTEKDAKHSVQTAAVVRTFVLKRLPRSPPSSSNSTA